MQCKMSQCLPMFTNLSCSDDLVQLCVDYLREYPLLVGSGLACPVLSYAAPTLSTINHVDHLLLDSSASGFLVANEGRGGETKKIQKGQKGEAGGQVSLRD